MTATAALARIVAHQGGWDEFLLVAAPVAFFAGLLWIANHRAKAQVRAEQDALGADEETDDPGRGGRG
ncbi:MAG: hypothetical protein S0880_23580 [Actinomycetota bacterium]|nr:hypothetical protein [Actinomycetota bacterium]